VTLGDVTIFDGRILALGADFPAGSPSVVVLRAEDRFAGLRLTRRTRTFADVSDRDVMQQIAAEHGLSPQIEVDGPVHAVLAQLNRTDLEFLRDRARLMGAELWIEGSTLQARPRERRGSGARPLTLGRNLRSFSVLADLGGQRTSVVVSGWDSRAGAPLRQEAGVAALGSELRDGASGASILEAGFGRRAESVVHLSPRTMEEARAYAEAQYRAGARRFVVGHGVADPSGDLRVGAAVDLAGLGPLFSIRYGLTEVRHRFDAAGGLRTEFVAESAALGNPPGRGGPAPAPRPKPVPAKPKPPK
jgi:phage protein D